MKVIQNTPDLLILRYRPVFLIAFGLGLTLLFCALTIFAFFNAHPFPTLVLALITGTVTYALHRQHLMVGVYCDKIHNTVAIYTQQLFSKRNAIYPLSDIESFDMQYRGLEERMIVRLRYDRYPHPLTHDYHRPETMAPAAKEANAWISATR